MILEKLYRLIKSNIAAAREAARDFETPFKKYEEFEAKQQQKQQESPPPPRQEQRQQRQNSQQQYQQQRPQTPPPVDKEKGYFAALEIPPTTDFDKIRAAYKKLMKQYHPDRFHNQPEKQRAAEQISKKLNEAYDYFEKKYKK